MANSDVQDIRRFLTGSERDIQVVRSTRTVGGTVTLVAAVADKRIILYSITLSVENTDTVTHTLEIRPGSTILFGWKIRPSSEIHDFLSWTLHGYPSGLGASLQVNLSTGFVGEANIEVTYKQI